MGRNAPASVRFQRFVDAGADGCHYWTGCLNSTGYGEFWNGKKKELAHRFIFKAVNGSLRDEQNLLHSCDQTTCVNPAHLRVGTQRENTRDAIERGRYVSKQKLTDDQVREMAWFFEIGNHTQKSIGKIYGIDPSVVSQIKNRKLDYAVRLLGPI